MKRAFIIIGSIVCLLTMIVLTGMLMARADVLVNEQQVTSYTYDKDSDMYNVQYGYLPIKVHANKVKVRYHNIAQNIVYVREYRRKSFLLQHITEGTTDYELIILISTK